LVGAWNCSGPAGWVDQQGSDVERNLELMAEAPVDFW
jgi:hypothetical protein